MILLRKPEAKRPLERPTRTWKYNIKKDLKGIIWKAWNGLIRLATGQRSRLLWTRY